RDQRRGGWGEAVTGVVASGNSMLNCAAGLFSNGSGKKVRKKGAGLVRRGGGAAMAAAIEYSLVGSSVEGDSRTSVASGERGKGPSSRGDGTWTRSPAGSSRCSGRTGSTPVIANRVSSGNWSRFLVAAMPKLENGIAA